ncbi:MAG: tRNA 2-thiouridine(34) synthase MnmA [Acidobacteriota bacterium]
MRIALLLSGGVDSAVALHRLCDAGHEVHAFYLKIWLEDELADLGVCPWEEDLRFARAVCAARDVPLAVVPLQRLYHDRVVRHAIAELARGRTPSPDILCNQAIKFGAFYDALRARAEGDAAPFDRVASGHYARLRHPGGAPGDGLDGNSAVDAAGDAARVELWRGVDPVKDQTYFLVQLAPDQLARCCFPLGDSHKAAVRAEARARGLPNRDRPDSQGICFLGKIPYDAFVDHHLGQRPGPIRDIDDGRTLGTHRGLWFHTIGQRRGLGLGGGPWYVVDKSVDDDVLWVVHGDRLTPRRRDRFVVDAPRWLGASPAPDDAASGDAACRLTVKVRHTASPAPCRITVDASGAVNAQLDVPDAGLASGQMAVFYDGARCVGGGVLRVASLTSDRA